MKAKRIIKLSVSLLLMFLLVFSVLMFRGCPKKTSYYSEEKHLERIKNRIEKNIIKNLSEYTDFSVYPLYNQNDELNLFLVEFEPSNFLFIFLRDENWKGLSCFGVSTSMYRMSTIHTEWSPYTVDETDSQPYPDTDKRWQLDENGNKIKYNKSPYYVTQNIQKKKYLLYVDEDGYSGEYICAIKQGDNFTNLISSTEIKVLNEDLIKKQAYLYISTYADKRFEL